MKRILLFLPALALAALFTSCSSSNQVAKFDGGYYYYTQPEAHTAEARLEAPAAPEAPAHVIELYVPSAEEGELRKEIMMVHAEAESLAAEQAVAEAHVEMAVARQLVAARDADLRAATSGQAVRGMSEKEARAQERELRRQVRRTVAKEVRQNFWSKINPFDSKDGESVGGSLPMTLIIIGLIVAVLGLVLTELFALGIVIALIGLILLLV